MIEGIGCLLLLIFIVIPAIPVILFFAALTVVVTIFQLIGMLIELAFWIVVTLGPVIAIGAGIYFLSQGALWGAIPLVLGTIFLIVQLHAVYRWRSATF